MPLNSSSSSDLINGLEGSPLALVVWDADFHVARWSKRAEQMFGWGADEILGKTPGEWAFVHENDVGLVTETMAELFRREWRTRVVHNRNYTKDGRVLHCAWYITPIWNEDGDLEAVFSLVQDETQTKALEEELRASKRAAESASRLKSAFLANMSHEIRAPLGVILGFAELLSDPELLQTERDTFLDAIHRNGQLLSRLIDDILDLSKVEAGRLEIRSNETSIRKLVGEVLEDFQSRAFDRDILLNWAFSMEVPEIVETDVHRFKQILSNLVGNALKFTEVGEVTVTATAKRISEDRAMLSVLVRDTGAGMGGECQERLFEPFLQTEMSARAGGTGLGLSLSRKIARAMGGDLKLLRSRMGEGTTFELSVPVKVSTGKIAFLQESGEHCVVPLLPLRGLRILLAEDAKDNQILLDRVLRKRGATIVFADDGEEAVSMALKAQFDLVLMDIQMPKVDGYEATRMLRSRGYPVPIVALTAHAMREERQKCLEAGCNEHLPKPIEAETLVQAIVRLTSGRFSEASFAH